MAALLLALAVVLAGCHAGRLRGENYDAEEAPFIRWDGPADAIAATGPADTARVVFRIILAGDTGEPVPEDPTLAAIGAWAVPPERTAVVLLGDNLYPSGLEEASRAWGESILRQQLEATTALRIFVPGNHDWGSSPGDWTGERVIAQQEFILDWREGDVDFLPRDGCPGPAVRELLRPGEAMERGIAIVAIDWLPWFSKVHDSSRCPDGEFGQRIDDVFASLENHHVIVASHYPLRSAGDRADLGRGMLIDALVNLYHLLLRPRSELNLFHPEYVVLAEKVETALVRHRPLVYAAGHDHSLQVFEGDEVARIHIVSGAGSVGKVTRVTDLPRTIFAHAVPGFVVLDFVDRGGAVDRAGTANNGGAVDNEGAVVPVVRVVRTGREAPVFEMRIP